MATTTTDSERFKTLLAFGKFFSFIGWVVVIIGVIVSFVGVSQLGQRSGFGGGTSPLGPAGLVAGLLVAVYGLILVASGQGISCFVSIENNTHATMVAQQAILSLIRGQTQPSTPTQNLQAKVEKPLAKDEVDKVSKAEESTIISPPSAEESPISEEAPLAISDEERLITAAKEGDVQTVKALLDAGIDVNAKGNAGMTALMHASRNNHIDCVKILISARADVRIKNELGRTALKIAEGNGYHEIVKLLKEAGA